MTIIHKTILFFCCLFIFACVPEGDPVGHWHIVDDKYPDKRYWTVDILNDSVAIAGINHINGTSLGTHDFHEKEMVYLWECGSGVFKYKVRGDKMYLDQYELDGSFSGFRCNEDCCDKKEELLMDLKVEIELAEIQQQREVIKPVELPRHLSLQIILGKPKKVYQEEYRDNISMQLNDKFAPIKSIPFFIEEKKQDTPTEDRKDINIEIIMDQNIPLSHLKPVIQKLKELKIENIWIAYFRENKETGSLLEFVHASTFNFSSNKTLKEYIPIKIGQKKEAITTAKKEVIILKEEIDIPKKAFNIQEDLLAIIRASSKQLSGTKYSVAKKTDCSGMFHQLLNTLRDNYPEYKFPNINNARSSRDIALWYSKHRNFTIIRDIEKSSHLIQPGMVMFYGYGDPKIKYNRKKLNMQILISRNIGINHIAVVTDVHIKNGVLESYDIFHGRNSKHPASITTSRRIYLNRPNVPSYGNGMEPLLGVAKLFVRE